jgi:hypothetical protein
VDRLVVVNQEKTMHISDLSYTSDFHHPSEASIQDLTDQEANQVHGGLTIRVPGFSGSFDIGSFARRSVSDLSIDTNGFSLEDSVIKFNGGSIRL